ncbi:WD40-repeat-containing domain protein [Dipodascopsis tothii]|uniref:WD40-repeat-containing domain protein n=1 Tax=Dipodascopsis tothii TaxID=44089 RepID=UPI0034CE47DF
MTVPIVRVDPAFPEILRAPDKQALWVSVATADRTVHATLDVFPRADGPLVHAPPDSAIAVAVAARGLRVSADGVAADVRAGAPAGPPAAVFDVSPGGELVAAGGADGVLAIVDRAGRERVRTEAHAIYVARVRFFPSGQVVLTAGGDMQIKLWDALSGDCARAFRGHRRAVTDIAMVGRGRNFVSVSADGTVRVWECSTAKTVFAAARPPGTATDAAATHVAVLERPGPAHPAPAGLPAGLAAFGAALPTEPPVPCDRENEFEIEGKLAAVAYDDGTVAVLDLHARAWLCTAAGAPATGLAAAGTRLAVARGRAVAVWDSADGAVADFAVAADVLDLATDGARLAVAVPDGAFVAAPGGAVDFYAAGLPRCTAAVLRSAVYFGGPDGICRY